MNRRFFLGALSGLLASSSPIRHPGKGERAPAEARKLDAEAEKIAAERQPPEDYIAEVPAAAGLRNGNGREATLRQHGAHEAHARERS